MSGQQTLEQKITGHIELGNSLPEVPPELKNNLNTTFELRPYQVEAFGRFVYYMTNKRLRQKPSQLLFHMATGSGKTLIMAGAIFYLYKQGYRNFLFFVNSTNIINKTRDNFLNPLSSKYLFSESVAFGEKKVRTREVENFQAANPEDINIVFSTVQGLHSRLNTPRENSITYDDFADKKTVLISDEAHHINVETKKGRLSKEEQEEVISWEGTVNRIFHASPENLLLEFTATVDFSIAEISAKYSDKHLFDYPLKQFRIDGYSKEVKVLQSDVELIERALQALILSQYRRKVFEKNQKHIKPVLLFKSKTIAESKSFHAEFVEKMRSLKETDISSITKRADTTLKRCFDYFERSGITLDNLAQELKNDFAEDKCIEVNSKEESEEKQIAVNTLEDEANEYRAVFAVDKLNEGWDVLNLFDIVRLYDTRDAKEGKPGNTTISEAQLIGRGARYCPFQIEPTQPKYQRKYDKDVSNELRVCEELYYHSAYNPKYIQELDTALQEIGIKAKATKEIQLHLKLDFKKSDLYREGLVFLNDQIGYDRAGIFSLPKTITEQTFAVSLRTGAVQTTTIFENSVGGQISTKRKDFYLTDFGLTIARKALSRLEFCRFSNLKALFPNLSSTREFIASEKYLGKVKVEIEATQEKLAALQPDEKLQIVVNVLMKISESLQSEQIEHQGTQEFKPHRFYEVFKDKTLNIFVKEGGEQEYGVPQSEAKDDALRIDLSKKDWYVFADNYGTSEEKHFVKFIDKTYDALREKYDRIFLVRNEKHFQLFNFDDGKAMEPDFVLFLRKKEPEIAFHYQVFIEPKGKPWAAKEPWKEKFLKSLEKRHRITVLWKNKKYRVWGMPFFSEEDRREFEDAFNSLLK